MNLKRAEAVTPEKGSRYSGISKNLENLNPNVLSPGLKLSNSPLVKSTKGTKKAVCETLAEEQELREEFCDRKEKIIER
ncbi:Hypothetical predicted protein [Olea europaea subsp. europaea]|uniref:Uncharacterized protein n=1 Tax=Olea europaea subsp. europaea TaxID=158383 RepID=A0A8S0PBX8_OLEEU|nr:Hypothetical predicted protein [Olea europaea subsp. europaea]